MFLFLFCFRTWILYHITGEHEWSLDACQHGPLEEDRDVHRPPKRRPDGSKEYVISIMNVIKSILISHHLSHYVLYQQKMFRNLDKVFSCNSMTGITCLHIYRVITCF